jgi:serine/threonine protein kinase
MGNLSTCPSKSEWARYLLGDIDEVDATVLEQHLESCAPCAASLGGIPAEDRLVDSARSALPGLGSCVTEEQVQGLVQRVVEAGGRFQQSSTATQSGDSSKQTAAELYAFLAPPLEAGELGRLGHYRVLRVLGAGGMGVVFLAEDTHLQRRVALKTMRSSLAASARARDRFLREARAAAGLKHDHIVTIYQVGEDRGMPFLAMELLHGESLEQRLERQGKLPVGEAIRIAREIALGLGAAHAQGLIHRDIKPGNIWLEARDEGREAREERSGASGERGDERGEAPGEAQRASHLLPLASRSGPLTRVKILDFGLARAGGDAQAASHGENSPASQSHTLTQAGAIMGTAAYMAPEQARGETVDARSDLFSLGCVLYQMCTGKPPFGNADVTTTLVALENSSPARPRSLGASVPVPLERLILRLLAKNPADRPLSAQQVAHELALEAGRRQRGRRRLLTALAATAALILLAVALYVLRPGKPNSAGAGSTPQGPAPACHFTLQTRYAVGRMPYAVATGDFDGDGNIDLAVTSLADNSVSILRGNGDGTFQKAVPFATGARPHGIVAGDFNRDGKLDLAVANHEADTVSIHLGNGDGTFRPASTLPTPNRPLGLALADFNGDGVPDLAVACTKSALAVFLGRGDGTFQQAFSTDLRGSPISIAVGDLNGDGKLDLVVSGSSNDKLTVYLGNGDGTFQTPAAYPVGSGPGVVVLGDFNGDGKLDAAVENFGTSDVSVLLGTGDGNFLLPAASYAVGTGPGGLALGDFNGDGRPDLVVANHNSANLSVLAGNGDGTFRLADSLAAAHTPAGVAVADFNGDGKPDIVVVNHYSADVSVFLNKRPTPSFRLSAPLMLKAGSAYAFGITALDVNKLTEPNYTGRLRFTCTDPQADMPQAEDVASRESAVYQARLKTAGAQVVTVTDVDNPERQGSITVIVVQGTTHHLNVKAPAEAVVGQPVKFWVTPVDEFNNPVDEFRGRVHIASSDTKAVLPPDHTFVNAALGAHACTATFHSPGRQTITVKDNSAGSISGSCEVLVKSLPMDK